VGARLYLVGVVQLRETLQEERHGTDGAVPVVSLRRVRGVESQMERAHGARVSVVGVQVEVQLSA
jgi:hypothetical protein